MVNLLQMNRQDLLVYLEEQSMENPLLEVDDAIYSYMPSESEENWIEQLEGRERVSEGRPDGAADAGIHDPKK